MFCRVSQRKRKGTICCAFMRLSPRFVERRRHFRRQGGLMGAINQTGRQKNDMTDRSDVMAGSYRKGAYLGRRMFGWNLHSQRRFPYVMLAFCDCPECCVSPVYLGGGCIQTAMLPAQQLESETTVVSSSIDVPAQLNAQVTGSFGSGGRTFNLSGFPLLYLRAGLTGRCYLKPGQRRASVAGS